MTWGSWLKPRDASGRESRTLAFVGITWLIMVVRFAAGGLIFEWGPIKFHVETALMLDFGGAVAAVLAIWVGREWVRKEKSDV